MIDGIYLDEQKFKSFITVENDRELKNISKINIFIGGNNSGKSRFLRTLFSHHSVFYKSKFFRLKDFNDLIENFKKELNDFSQVGKIVDSDKDRYLNELEIIRFVSIGLNFDDKIRRYLQEIANYNKEIISIQGHNNNDLLKRFASIGRRYLDIFDKLNDSKNYDFRLRNLYIPTLRGLRDISGSNKDLFLDCTVKDYFSSADIDGNIKGKIYTGLSLYDDTKKLLLGPKEDRDKVKRFETFLKETFFNNEEINIIPRIGKNVVYFRIGDHEEHPIYELGDGIQSLIILTYPLFFKQGEKLNFFIEEPENYLHPGFQRVYIETLLKFSDYQYFITTHSNHILDLTLDKEHISIFTFKKKYSETNEPIFTIENVENDYSNILESIGARNSSVFLSNCTIWVEGITDRIYIRKYLEIYQTDESIKFKEDLHYSFVEYGGNNITHWSFLDAADTEHPNIEVERLCGKLFLISDKDGVNLDLDKSAKAQRQKQLREKLGERYYCLKSREIENMLSIETLKQTVNALDKKGCDIAFNPDFNEDSSYKDEKLGSFLDSHILNSSRKYADESGTIKDKLSFAKTAIKFIKTKEDLSIDALDLAKRLYDFITNLN